MKASEASYLSQPWSGSWFISEDGDGVVGDKWHPLNLPKHFSCTWENKYRAIRGC